MSDKAYKISWSRPDIRETTDLWQQIQFTWDIYSWPSLHEFSMQSNPSSIWVSERCSSHFSSHCLSRTVQTTCFCRLIYFQAQYASKYRQEKLSWNCHRQHLITEIRLSGFESFWRDERTGQWIDLAYANLVFASPLDILVSWLTETTS
jgi:hypothetical protein